MVYSIKDDGNGGDSIISSHANHRGDVIARSNESSSLTSFALYEAYGTRPYEWGDDPDRQKANTKEEESDLGLLNEGMRFRDLETGTFLTRDPIGYADGANIYCYVHGNPITRYDPTGEFGPGGALWGAITGAVSGFSSGMAASGGDFRTALESAGLGAITGGIVGFIAPPGMEGAAGGAVGGAAGSLLGQAMTGDGSINMGAVAGSALGGAAAGALGNIASAGLSGSAAQVAKGAGELLGSAIAGILGTTGAMAADILTSEEGSAGNSENEGAGGDAGDAGSNGDTASRIIEIVGEANPRAMITRDNDTGISTIEVFLPLPEDTEKAGD